jgi:hypothetical protein
LITKSQTRNRPAEPGLKEEKRLNLPANAFAAKSAIRLLEILLPQVYVIVRIVSGREVLLFQLCGALPEQQYNSPVLPLNVMLMAILPVVVR